MMVSMIEVRPLTGDDGAWKEGSLRRAWGGTEVARMGELIDAMRLTGLVALRDGTRAGLLTFAVRETQFEIVTIHTDLEGVGVGQALMNAARDLAVELGARRMWLTTTNNNVRALRFYQLWGMDLVALSRDGVARSRAAKPSIPLVDDDGVAIRHELEFELLLD